MGFRQVLYHTFPSVVMILNKVSDYITVCYFFAYSLDQKNMENFKDIFLPMLLPIFENF